MYQLIIIGAGPAGLTAGIYAKRYGIKFLIFGQPLKSAANEAHLVKNYPGIKSVPGPQLIKKFQKHLNVKIKEERIEKIAKKKHNAVFEIFTNKNKYQTESLILALGAKTKKLNIKNEKKFLNKGTSYYIPDDINLKNKTIAVIGGGDSALTTAIKASKQAKKVYLIHRRNKFRGAPSLVKKAKNKTNIEIIYSANVTEARGKKRLEKIILDNKNELEINQLFIEIGGVPNVYLCQELKIKTENNFIAVDKNQAANVPGVFAAGDLTNNPLKQIITASAEGAIAAFSAYKYLRNVK